MGERDHPWKTDWSVTRVLQTRWPLPPFIPPEALERGGYEIDVHTSMLAGEALDTIVDSSLQVLDTLFA